MFEHTCDKKCLYSFILFEEMQGQYLKNICVIFEVCTTVYDMFIPMFISSNKEEIRGKMITSLQFLLEPRDEKPRGKSM